MATRIEAMDLLRGMAILGVVIGHISAETLYAEITLLGLFFNQLIRFAVPVFIFLSGMGLSLSRKPIQGYLHFLWYRLRKLLPLYSLWSIIYLLVDDVNGPSLALGRIGGALISGGAAYHLYFIPLILQFYMAFPLLAPYLRRTTGLLVAFAITLVLQFINMYLPLPHHGLTLLTNGISSVGSFILRWESGVPPAWLSWKAGFNGGSQSSACCYWSVWAA